MNNLKSREEKYNLETIHKYYDGSYTIRLKIENGLLLVDLDVLGIIFKKTQDEFLKLPATISLIVNLGKVNRTQSPIIEEHKSSDDSFTWVHVKLALEYANWLNPGFKVALENYIKGYLIDLLAERHLGNRQYSDAEKVMMKKLIIQSYRHNERLNTMEKLLLTAYKAYHKTHKTGQQMTRKDMQIMFGHEKNSQQTMFNRYLGSI